jgi:hypothetical protein
MRCRLSLKQIIKEQQILRNTMHNEMVLPEEPLIYSIKFQIGSRAKSIQFFRNKKWRSFFKCFFRSYMNSNVPCVLHVIYYVSPPSYVNVSKKALKEERTPATRSFELCDYLLSFMEMLHHVLINSYRQIVRIEAEKYYSSNPRTVFKFMKWEQYEMLKDSNTVHSESQSIGPDWEIWALQSVSEGDEVNHGLCEEQPAGTEPVIQGAASGDCALQDSVTLRLVRKKTQTAKIFTAPKKAGWRQFREVPE